MKEIITVIIKIPIFVCAFWASCLISVLFHELGHALGYMLATGDRNWHVQVGQGKNLLTTKAVTVKMFVIDGFFAPAENKADSKAQLVMTLSGGPIVSLLLVAGLSVLRFSGISIASEGVASGMIRPLLNISLLINLLILLWSVIPAYGFFRDKEDVGTDVMQMINALKHDRK